MAQTSDGTVPSEFSSMTDEDRAWLETVMREGVLDEVERMTHIIRILNGEDPIVVFGKEPATVDDVPYTKDDLGEYLDILLDEMLTRVDQIDNAQTWVKLDGLPPLVAHMENARPSTRALAVEVFATVVQNNTFCQDAALKIETLLPLLMRMATTDDDQTCRVRGLLGISCLIRGHELGETKFIEEFNGVDALKSILSDEASPLRLQRKALFLMRYFVQSSLQHSESIRCHGFPWMEMLKLMATDDIELREGALFTVQYYLEHGEAFQDDFAPWKAVVHVILNSRVAEIELLTDPQEKEDAQTEFETIKSIQMHVLP